MNAAPRVGSDSPVVHSANHSGLLEPFGTNTVRNEPGVFDRTTGSVISLINPVVRFGFHLISCRDKELPPAADEFTSILKGYIATWAGRAGAI